MTPDSTEKRPTINRLKFYDDDSTWPHTCSHHLPGFATRGAIFSRLDDRPIGGQRPVDNIRRAQSKALARRPNRMGQYGVEIFATRPSDSMEVGRRLPESR